MLGYKKLKNLEVEVCRQQKNIVAFIKRHQSIRILYVFRNYSALVVIVFSVLLVCATNLSAGHESGGFLFGYFKADKNDTNPSQGKFFLQTNKITNVALAPLVEAKTVPDFNSQKNISDENNNYSMIVQGQALMAGTSPIRKDPEEDGGVVIYKVRSGDTVSSIASAHHITVNTILWANALDNPDSIMPGDEIFILPVSGLSYTVKKGDNLDIIAKKYKAQKDKIIAFNSLPADGKIEKGEKIIIPDGRKKTLFKKHTFSISTRRHYEPFNTLGKTLRGNPKSSHRFPYGYCTWYVAQRRYVPWSGNAGTWLYHAKVAGYKTSRIPHVGSIMVSSSSYWGHVAYVEKVSGNKITVSEMNYKAWGKKDYRTFNYHSRIIKGFIK